MGPEKYDETAMAMIAQLEYGSGVPFHRLEQLEAQLGSRCRPAAPWLPCLWRLLGQNGIGGPTFSLHVFNRSCSPSRNPGKLNLCDGRKREDFLAGE